MKGIKFYVIKEETILVFTGVTQTNYMYFATEKDAMEYFEGKRRGKKESEREDSNIFFLDGGERQFGVVDNSANIIKTYKMVEEFIR